MEAAPAGGEQGPAEAVDEAGQVGGQACGPQSRGVGPGRVPGRRIRVAGAGAVGRRREAAHRDPADQRHTGGEQQRLAEDQGAGVLPDPVERGERGQDRREVVSQQGEGGRELVVVALDRRDRQL